MSPLEGDYEPSPYGWVREQVAAYEASGGRRANTLRDTGLPIVVLTADPQAATVQDGPEPFDVGSARATTSQAQTWALWSAARLAVWRSLEMGGALSRWRRCVAGSF